jgi:peptide/nickel transport system permease protein
MYRYVIKRILLLIPVILAVSFLVFFMMDLTPGDVTDIIGSNYSTGQLEQLRHELGYDQSVFSRYLIYMKNLVQGDLGTSYIYKMPVWDLYMQRFPETLKLSLAGVAFALVLAIPLGIRSALKSGSLDDNISMFIALFGVSIPSFWLGLMLILVFSLNLKWFPSGTDTEGWKSLILPGITVGARLSGVITRTTRSSMLDVIRSDYLRTAQAKGVPERLVIQKHALRNALIPIITITGIQLGATLGGAVIAETVFSWPGVGRLIVDALNSRDTITATGAIIMTTILISVLMLIVDILYAFVDPRVKAQFMKEKKV